MLYVVNYRGVQVHSASPIMQVAGNLVIFEGGEFADVAAGTYQGVRLAVPGDPGYVLPGQRVGSGITVADVSGDGQYVYAKTAGGSVAASADGKYSVNLGDPDGADRGVQMGNGNTQVNRY